MPGWLNLYDHARERARTPRPPFDRRVDGTTLALLAVLVVVTRWPLKSRFLTAWDSVAFALAVEDYDVYAHRPHAPGYPAYVFCAKVVNVFVRDPNTSLILVGIMFSALAVGLLYAFLLEVGSRRAALLAATWFAAAPIFVFNGVIALSYATEAAASVAVAWLAWRVWRDPSPSLRSLVALSVVFALGIGLRQSLALFLGPVVLLAIIGQHRPLAEAPRHVAQAATAGLVGILAWFLPMVMATQGGWPAYRTATSIQGGLVIWKESIFVRGASAFPEHFARVRFYLRPEETTIVPWVIGAVVCAALVAVRFRPKDWKGVTGAPSGTLRFLVAWMVPGLAFYVTIFSGWDRGPTGYILVVLPALYACAGLVVDGAVRLVEERADFRADPRRWTAIVFAVVLIGPLSGLADQTKPWIEGEVRAHDDWSESWEGIRATFPANETAILAFYSWAHVKWYFPEYVVWGYFPIPRDEYPPQWELLLQTQDHRDEVPFYQAHANAGPLPPHPIPANIRRVIVFDFQMAGENGGHRILRDDVVVEEQFLSDGWRTLSFAPDGRPTIEDYLRPAANATRPA